MSPFKSVNVDGDTKLQLTLGATVALISTVVAHVLAASALFISVDRRVGALESLIGQHERRIERIEAKVYPTAMTTAGTIIR